MYHAEDAWTKAWRKHHESDDIEEVTEEGEQ